MKRSPLSLVAIGLVLFCPTRTVAQQPKPLRGSDLRISGVAVDDDSGMVRKRLGSPIAQDSNRWTYPDLVVSLANGKVSVLSLTGRSRRTARGLAVGDSANQVSKLYHPCFSDTLLAQVCYKVDDFDERAVIAELAAGRVRQINVGRIIEP